MLSHFTTSPRSSGADPREMSGCPSRIRTSVHGSKVRCPTTRRRGSGVLRGRNGAEDGTRTRDPHLGKVMLYQLSHFRPEHDHRERWCREPDSNWRHRDFQSRALPTELSRPDGQPAWGCPSAVGRIPRAAGPRPRASGAAQAPLGRRRSPQSRPARLAASVGASGPSPVSSRSRLMRSRIGGWVDIRPDERSSNFLIGFAKYRCCVAAVGDLERPPGRRRSWPAPARGPPGCASARPTTRRRGTRAGG